MLRHSLFIALALSTSLLLSNQSAADTKDLKPRSCAAEVTGLARFEEGRPGIFKRLLAAFSGSSLKAGKYFLLRIEPNEAHMKFTQSDGVSSEESALKIFHRMDVFLGIVDEAGQDLLIYLFFESKGNLRFPIGVFRFQRDGDQFVDWQWTLNVEEARIESDGKIISSKYQEQRNLFWSSLVREAYAWLKKRSPELFSALSESANQEKLPCWFH
ncbi:MAG: hypothetical protein EA369_08575 [Bradymonadales bacterium]|nr:MAG: hypothetical protein EA369_08575 [Bradymonadales bacterium]